MALQDDFKAAQDRVQKLSARPDNSALLELYSLYKQATEGDVKGDRPGGFDFKAKAKFDAWAKRKGMASEAAMRAYVDLVTKLAGT